MPINVQSTESFYHADYLEKQRAQGNGNSDLDKDAFLRILLTQLQNQDPMNPMEDKEFIAQMAQFSSLEQMTNMNANIESLVMMQMQQDFVSHSDLIGKKIEWEKVSNGDGDKEAAVKSGIVTSVVFKDGQAQLIVDGETKVNMKDVLSVTLPE